MKLIYKFLKFIFFSILFFLILSQEVFGSGFQLKTIGTLDMDGVTYNHIWYSNGNCLITGITQPNSTVTLKIDQEAPQSATADAQGNWSFQVSLSQGDHTLTFTDSSGAVITKTLTIGNIPSNIGTLPKAETPTVGFFTPTILLSLIGFLLIIFPFSKKRIFS